MKIIYGYTVPVLFLVALFLVQAGCQAGGMGYVGKTVRPERLIPLTDGGPHAGVWQTNDLKLDYAYSRAGDRLEMTGDISLGKGIIYNFRGIDYFYLHVSFVDAEGRILDSQNLYTAGYRKNAEHYRFHRVLVPPSDTRGMVFSYSGRASEGGSGGSSRMSGDGDSWDFWKTPTG